jgi:hypothetical protein
MLPDDLTELFYEQHWLTCSFDPARKGCIRAERDRTNLMEPASAVEYFSVLRC